MGVSHTHEVSLIAAIEEALAPLRGLPLWASGRAANILWLHFGARHPAPTVRNPSREVGDYALHVQCGWRVSAPGGVVAGRSDIYVPADPDVVVDEFRWDHPGASIADAQLRKWMDAHVTPPAVLDVAVDRCAGFVLRMPGGQAFEVFPDAFALPHDLREQWRIFCPASDAPHFVVDNHGWGEHPRADG